MPHRPRILKNLKVIPPAIRLIPKEMNRAILHPIRPLPLRFDMLQAIRLVPALGEDVEG